MALSLNQLQERLKAPKNKSLISKAIKLEQRIRFHTETNVSVNDTLNVSGDFLDWVKGLLPADKYNTFLQLFLFPLPTVAVVEDVYRELSRVFYSRNSNFTYHFSDSSHAADWKDYKLNKLKDQVIWKTDGWQAMKTAVNSLLVVDLPKQQKTELPEPYFYWLNIRNVVDFESHDGSTVVWVIIRNEPDSITVIDDTSYRIFKVKDNTLVSTVPLHEATHSLQFCPARFFWTDFLSEKNKVLKRNPIVKQLTNLDWFLFFETSKKHLDLYAPYPIYSAFEADCSFSNNDTGEYCDGGFLRNSHNEYIIAGNGALAKCPVCSEKRVAGPGSFLEVPIPEGSGPDLRNPVQITTVDKDSLDYNVKECERLKNNIIISCVGSNGLVSEKEAINTTQIAANFENKTSVLNSLKVNFEQAQQFVEDTICRLRYGTNYKSASISWGTEFYVFTVEELYTKYKTAKVNGSSVAELDSIVDQIIETEYRESPNTLQRMKILKQLEPYRHLTLDEALKLYDKGLATYEDITVKINLSSFIDKFERENTNIVDFGSKIAFDTKITKITQILYSYVKKIDGAGITKTANDKAEA